MLYLPLKIQRFRVQLTSGLFYTSCLKGQSVLSHDNRPLRELSVDIPFVNNDVGKTQIQPIAIQHDDLFAKQNNSNDIQQLKVEIISPLIRVLHCPASKSNGGW